MRTERTMNMKKFFKFLLGAGALIATIGGIMYFLKNVLMKDYLEDYDDDDFDNDLYDEDDASEQRDYVTIHAPETDSDSADETQEDDLSVFDADGDESN